MTLDDLRRNRNLLFWALHLLGWSAYLIAQYLSALLYEKPPAYLKLLLIAALGGFVLSAPLRYWFRWLWSQRTPVQIAGVLLGCWLTALAWRVLINLAYARLIEDWLSSEPWYGVFSGALSSTYLLLCYAGLYFGIKYYEQLQQQREEMLQAAALAREAQVKMLRYQINPHFLFNTLNAISTLILDGQARVANLAIGRLADFLRYTLDQDPMKKVTLRQELEALEHYLGIEQLRFGARLRLEYRIEDAAQTALVPSLILQPLVENALKHAVAPREDGGRVLVEARVRERSLELAVEDDGPGLPPGLAAEGGRGVGLRNTRERLATLYGDERAVCVRDAQPGLRVELLLPFERAVSP